MSSQVVNLDEAQQALALVEALQLLQAHISSLSQPQRVPVLRACLRLQFVLRHLPSPPLPVSELLALERFSMEVACSLRALPHSLASTLRQ